MAARSEAGIKGPVNSDGPGGVRSREGAKYSGRAVR
ncbi:unannotated protein [freshwater metagenome]|uniref:Unannotated protein n=1 Tax=freshwater metagenome TaxID=449393 RepID=A0A6J6EGL2_9ZZZZ